MLMPDWIIPNLKIQPIGLDLGHHSVKMVQLVAQDGRPKVLAARRVSMDLARLDEAQREQALVTAIRRLLADGQFRGQRVVSALPVEKVRITSVRLPEAEADQADRVLRREAAERFDLDPAHGAIEYLLAGSVCQGEDVKNEYILFAVDEETVTAHIRLLEAAGLIPAALDAPPCALFRAFERSLRRQADKERTVIFIDVGYRSTIVVFGRGGEISFVKQIPIGMEQFNDEVASALGTGAVEAESFRRRLQREEPIEPAMRRHVIDALNHTSDQLAAEIALCLRYYTVTFRGKPVERAILAGGGAYEQVLQDVLRRHLSVEVEVAEPLRGFEFSPDRVDPEGTGGSADLALAVGLSLKGWDATAGVEGEGATPPELVQKGGPL